jgi:FlaG/FlaF family flagellin (archaellin)
METDVRRTEEKKGEGSMKLQNETAVSPVVGVMLMLVVVIIIAAVVSGFAGGLVGGSNQKAPQLTVDAKIANGGYWTNSYFVMTVTGEDQAIATKDLKIVTSWSKVLPDGTKITNGSTIIPGKPNYHIYYIVNGWTILDDWKAVVPLGYGPGVSSINGSTDANFWPFEPVSQSACAGGSTSCAFSDVNGIALTNNSWFGNYNLLPGTTMLARPFGGAYGNTRTGASNGAYQVGYGITSTDPTNATGAKPFQYSYGQSYNAHSGTSPVGATAYLYNTVGLDSGQSEDMMMGVLGPSWYYLRPGDTVNIKIVHTPTGKTIVNKDVSVEG